MMRKSCVLLCTALPLCGRAASDAGAPAPLEDLPLVVLQSDASQDALRHDAFALLLSGDGGWAPLPRTVSEGLLTAGISVIGLNSRRYLRHRRTPEETAHDVERILDYYSEQWARSRILLIGYSRGADVLPFVINRLSPATQARIALAALLNPATETRFAAGSGDSSPDPPHRGSLQLMPEVTSLHGVDVLCVYGVGDKHALCPALPADRYDVLAIGHGHHFDHDYAALVEAIVSRIPDAAPRLP
jgi:type IV secretory pathway VirJ component